MILVISGAILKQIHAHGESAYPEEGVGLLLGRLADGRKKVVQIYVLPNNREAAARHNRYLLTSEDYARGEREAELLGLEVLGVFHSHPDHPSRPSEFDRQWALPWFSYLITSVCQSVATESRSYSLMEDCTDFIEEPLVISDER